MRRVACSTLVLLSAFVPAVSGSDAPTLKKMLGAEFKAILAQPYPSECDRIGDLRSVLNLLQLLAQRYPLEVRPPADLQSLLAEITPDSCSRTNDLRFVGVKLQQGGVIIERRVPEILLAKQYLSAQDWERFQADLAPTTQVSLNAWKATNAATLTVLESHLQKNRLDSLIDKYQMSPAFDFANNPKLLELLKQKSLEKDKK